ncbi:redoxin domain-containing protein [Micromonospora sp. WMMD1082]|uniref:TlpA family protein disulfide reductase n=1 Tax=Micromonospora sp. WMMD1082 TaxID=3016104 RepID=UPI002415CD0C|nr:redoxin domain-containing protein [Micromonospora sp. WMMD1082]MDG4798222.1 redoxin domain-containing protein [Micromonospora sp. WMMD1082]
MTRPPVARRAVLVAAAAAAGLVATVPLAHALRPGAATRAAPADRAAPPLAGTGPDGTFFDLTTLHGQVIVVTVWASWCAPCRREFPVLLAALERWHGAGLRVVGLNTADRPESARRFLREAGAQAMPVVSDQDGRHAVAWAARGVPETIVVDRGGLVAARHQGEVTWAWLQSSVEPLLA